MYTQLISNLDELGLTDIEPYLSDYLTETAKEGLSPVEIMLEITKREQKTFFFMGLPGQGNTLGYCNWH